MTVAVDSRELMARAQGGDLDAFAEIYRHYRPVIHGYVRSRVPQYADDITQDVFVKALLALPRWRDQGRGAAPWLIVIAANAVASHYRTGYARRVELGDPPDRPDPARGPEELAEQAQACRRVRAAMQELTDEQREAVELRYLRGLTAGETARATGRERQATVSMLYRARRALADQLAGAVADA